MSKHIVPNVYYTYEAGGETYSVMITDEGKLVVSTKGRVQTRVSSDGAWSMVAIWHSEATWLDKVEAVVRRLSWFLNCKSLRGNKWILQ